MNLAIAVLTLVASNYHYVSCLKQDVRTDSVQQAVACELHDRRLHVTEASFYNRDYRERTFEIVEGFGPDCGVRQRSLVSVPSIGKEGSAVTPKMDIRIRPGASVCCKPSAPGLFSCAVEGYYTEAGGRR